MTGKEERDGAQLLQDGQVLLEVRRRLLAETNSRQQAQNTARIALMGLLVVVTAGVGAAITVVKMFPMEKYIYTDNAKAICEAQVQDEPLITTNTVLDFTKECILDLDTFAHDTFDRDLSRMANRCLTPQFRKKFLEVDWLNDRVATVRQNFFRVSSQSNGQPILAASGPVPEGYKWVVQVPVRRTFRQGDTPRGTNEKVYEVEVYRVVRNAYNPVGLGINQIVEKSAGLR
ncbi:DotI/IcmL/TraM family protein [Paracidovorax wautersii]|uniref:Macrophage killing protein with similarity to conjugation protein n=1 Tax=Paracidovorax wautersii TaxID=1177982 RepID=A0A1I2HQ77_9BURK|nr:DotI/IcmL/TraM family protein [Paracidovorax wautersii]SFF31822.1 Macrophage killing protein with similarity to conjugation protein [Paracidovorax wautersii]